MAQFPGLMLWTDAWVADTCHLRGPIGRQKRCLYIDLLIKMWRTPGCRVPNDDAWLAEHLFLTSEEVVELLRPVIKEFCQTDGNWIFQKRLQREFVRAFQLQVIRSDAAKARERKKKRRTSVAHPDQNRKIDSYLYRARAGSGVDNVDNCAETEPDEPKQEAAEKEGRQVLAELIQFVAKKGFT